MTTTRKLFIVLTILLWAGAAFGQDSRGSRSRHHGAQRASANGSSHRADQQTAAFLQRADTNHNGMIDEDDLSGCAKTIVEGILTRLGIELKYPIPLSKIVVTAGGDQHRGSRDDSATESSSQGESSSGDSHAAATIRGFGAAKPASPAVPGFGQAGAKPKGGEAKSAAPSTPASTASAVQARRVCKNRPSALEWRSYRFRPARRSAKTNRPQVRAIPYIAGTAPEGSAGVVPREGCQSRRPSGNVGVRQRLDCTSCRQVQSL